MGKIVSFRIDDESISKAMQRFGLTVDDTKELTAKINSKAVELFKSWLNGENQISDDSKSVIEDLKARLNSTRDLLSLEKRIANEFRDDAIMVKREIEIRNRESDETGLVLVTKLQKERIESSKVTIRGLRKKLKVLDDLFVSLTRERSIPQGVNSKVDEFDNWLGD